jgi:hypothetical protein
MDAAVTAVTSDQVLCDFSKGYIISISESGRTISEAPGVYSEDRECEPFVHILQ